MLRVFSVMVMLFGAVALVGCVPVTPDPCDGVECPDGQECVDGECVAVDPCEGVECPDGQECVDGECVAVDPCEGVECPDGQECVDGECVAVDPCEGVECPDGQECVDGECVPVDGGDGDPTAGAAFYTDNCVGCHAADGAGGFGPNIQGYTAAELQAGVEEFPAFHGMAITADDYANLEAYLAGF